MAFWLQTPAGHYLAEWESAQFDRVVSDVFGYHGLQLGLPSWIVYAIAAFAIVGWHKTT